MESKCERGVCASIGEGCTEELRGGRKSRKNSHSCPDGHRALEANEPGAVEKPSHLFLYFLKPHILAAFALEMVEQGGQADEVFRAFPVGTVVDVLSVRARIDVHIEYG